MLIRAITPSCTVGILVQKNIFIDFELVMMIPESLHVTQQVGYYFAPSGKPYPDNWIITDVIYEIEGFLGSRYL